MDRVLRGIHEVKVVVFFDGGIRVRHGIAAGGAVVYDEAGNELVAAGHFIERKGDEKFTNNVAEYAGLHLALELALAMGATEADVYGDSEVVVRQVNQQYATRKTHLVPLRAKAWELGRRFERVSIKETLPGLTKRRRDNNERADELCRMAMNERRDVTSGPRISTEEVNMETSESNQPEEGTSAAEESGAEKLEESRPDEERGTAGGEELGEGAEEAGSPESTDGGDTPAEPDAPTGGQEGAQPATPPAGE